MRRKRLFDRADSRPRIWLAEVTRGGQRVGWWSRHPAAAGTISPSLADALEHALAEIGHVEAVIVWGGAFASALPAFEVCAND